MRLTLAVLLFAVAMPAWAQRSESEPNNIASQANLLVAGDSLDAVLSVSPGPGLFPLEDDVDYFTFTATQNGGVEVLAYVPGNTAPSFDISRTGPLQIYDEAGRQVTWGLGDLGDVGHSRVSFLAVAGQRYYVRYARHDADSGAPGAFGTNAPEIVAERGAAGKTTVAGSPYRIRVRHIAPSAPRLGSGFRNVAFSTSAYVSTLVDANGYSATVTFEYGLTPALGQRGRPIATDGSVVYGEQMTVPFEIQGLAPRTLYFARAVAVNAAGTFTGETFTFTTPARGLRRASGIAVDLTPLSGAAFSDDRTAFLTDAAGAIFRSTDGGAFWNVVRDRTASPNAQALTAIAFADAQRGVAVGADGIVQTTDGGTSWRLRAEAAGVRLVDVAFDGPLGLAVGYETQNPRAGVALRTQDAGATWTRVAGTFSPLSQVALSGRRAFVIGASVLASNDGGLTLEAVTRPTSAFSEVAFAGPDLAVVIGRDAVMRTSDGGATWSSVSLAVDPSNPFAPSEVAFGVNGVGFAVGSRGFLMRTDDAGATWVRVEAGTDASLGAIAMRRNALVVGGSNHVVLTGTVVPTGTSDVAQTGTRATLDAPAPNPASGSVRVPFTLTAPARVHLTAYDMLGRLVDVLEDGMLAPGAHLRTWQPTSVAPGVYVLRLTTDGTTHMKTVVLR